VTLQADLDSFCLAWQGRVGKGVADQISSDIDALRRSDRLEGVARYGDAFPKAPRLLDQNGRNFDLAAVITERPSIILFYRGGFCPYCNITLRHYQDALPRIRAAGAELIAIGPETPLFVAETAEKNDLTFPVLSDAQGGLSSALGIRTELSPAVRKLYESVGLNLPRRNGEASWTLPLPVVFVVAKGGTILARFLDPDFRKRADASEPLAVILSGTVQERALQDILQ
jgi:peroxiredoxin